MKNFPFFCYLNDYNCDPIIYHFKPDIYSYDNIHNGTYPKVCFTYLECFDFKKYHYFNADSDSILEWTTCKIDETCDTFVDIGANCGFTSYYAYLKGAKNILSFEPSLKENKAFLMNNIPNTTLYSMAISDFIGFKKLGSIWGNSSPSFCVTLDYLFEQNILTNVDFLKIDVEGHEYNVFNGLNDENLKKIKNISLELHGMNVENDPTIGKLFLQNLQQRLWNVGYFNGESLRCRYTFLLIKSETDQYLYSIVV